MEDMSSHIIVSLILLLALLFILLLSNRIYTNRQIRLRNLQLQGNSHPASSSPPSSQNTALGWHRIPGTFTRSPTSNGLRFTPSPQGRGDVVVNMPIGVQFWNGRDFLSRAYGGENSIDDTPSVWGIDLGRRGARGGLRGGAAVLVPRPGAIVIESTTRGPEVVGIQGGRRGVQDDVPMEEGEGLPRYEEPPPGYEKVLEEGGLLLSAIPGDAAGDSHGSTVRENASHVAVRETDPPPDPPPDPPRTPEPAVTRDRTAT